MRSKVKAALTYPAIVLGVAVVMVSVLLTFVVPKLTQMYYDMGQTLPFLTRVVVGISNFIVDDWWLLALTLLVALFLGRRSLREKKGKRLFYQLLLKVPVAGDLAVRSDMGSFSRVLGMLLSSGVGILEALRVTASVLEVPAFVLALETVRQDVSQGVHLSEALVRRSIFPEFVTQMIAIGEESGDLDNALFRVARTYDRDVERRLKTVTTILEPLMIVVVGLIVAVIILAMLLPIFQIDLLI